MSLLKSILCGIRTVFTGHSHYVMSRQKITVAVCQMTTTEDKRANLKQGKQLVMKSKELGARMAFLPEGFDVIESSRSKALEFAELIDGPTVSAYKEVAKQLNIWLSLGGFKQRSTDPARLHNTHILVNSSGQIAAEYRKMHLFDVDIPGKVKLSESDFTIRGDSIVEPIDTPAGRIGLATCYDLRFPELSTLLRRRGAQVLTYPSAFTVPTGRAHWEILLRARAIENQCYVIAAAQVGQHNTKRTSYGHSVIIDPWGKVLCEVAEGIGVATAEIDLDMLEQMRLSMPVERHRRSDVYQLINVPTHTLAIDDRENYKFSHFPIPSSCVFFKTKLSFAFVNKKPVLPGHMLVGSLREVKLFTEMTAEETVDMFETVRRVGEAVKKEYQTESLTISIQDGPEAGQSVQHVHVHVLPRHPGDFANNDDIYEKLSSHDKTENGSLLQEDCPLWRTTDVMSEEALRMRKYFL